MTHQNLVVIHWRRYGKDRLYVETSTGAKVGFWDLVTETGHPKLPDGTPALLTAVENWKSSNGVPDTGPEHSSAAQKRTLTPPAHTAEPPPPRGGEAHDRAAAATFLGVERQGDPGDPVVPHLDAGAVAPDGAVAESARPWVDLAASRAGAEARERARSARESAPVKTVLGRVLGVHTDERAWRIGADGEEKVAAQLAKVAKQDTRWRFLHAIPVGSRGSDIDHLIIGPGGLFTANAKHHPGAKIWVSGTTFMVNGVKQPYVRNARHEAERAARLLTDLCGFPVHVEGLIVTVNADDVVVKAQPAGVSVVPRMQVARWLLRHGDVHTPETIEAMYEVARRSTTWRS